MEATAKAVAKWVKEEMLKTNLRKIGAQLVKPAFKAAMARVVMKNMEEAYYLASMEYALLLMEEVPLSYKKRNKSYKRICGPTIKPHIEAEIQNQSFQSLDN